MGWNRQNGEILVQWKSDALTLWKRVSDKCASKSRSDILTSRAQKRFPTESADLAHGSDGNRAQQAAPVHTLGKTAAIMSPHLSMRLSVRLSSGINPNVPTRHKWLSVMIYAHLECKKPFVMLKINSFVIEKLLPSKIF